MKVAALLIYILTFSTVSMAQKTVSNLYHLIVGTYTNESKTNGIHVYFFNAETGEIRERSKVVTINNPSYLAISEDRKNLYAVSEGGDDRGIVAYSFDPTNGKLNFMNSGSSGGKGPCYITVDDQKQTVFAGNYGSGSLSATRLNEDGSLSGTTQSIQHQGSSVNKSRQDKPHVHAVVLSPDNRYLFVPDLGTDQVKIYRVNAGKDRPLSPASPPHVAVKPGGGPRHFTFHPNGRWAYLVLEMEGAVVAFDYSKGELKEKQLITMLAQGFKGKVGAADIHISPDGKFLYASNRGEANEIVIYSIDNQGKLTYKGRHGEGINTPRNFAIDPTGKYLMVANQGSNDILIFKRDPESGMITSTGNRIEVDKPVCLKFVPIQ